MVFSKNFNDTLKWMFSGEVDEETKKKLLQKKNKSNSGLVNDFNKQYESKGYKLIPSGQGEGGQNQWQLQENLQLEGTGSLYNEDGSKRDLGVGFGEPSSVTGDTAVNVASLKEENKLLHKKTIASTNARASLANLASGQASGKGSVGKNLLTLQKMREEQNPVADTTVEQKVNETKGVSTIPDTTKQPDSQKMNLNLKGLDEASATRIGNMQSFMNNASPKMTEILSRNPAMAEDLLRDASKGIGVDAAAGGIGAAGAMKIASTVLGMMQKKEKAPTPGLTVHTGAKSPDEDYLAALQGMSFYS